MEERFGDGHPEDGLATPSADGQEPAWVSAATGDLMPIGRRQYVEAQLKQAADRGEAPPFHRDEATEMLAQTLFRNRTKNDDTQMLSACLEIKQLQASAEETGAGVMAFEQGLTLSIQLYGNDPAGSDRQVPVTKAEDEVEAIRVRIEQKSVVDFRIELRRDIREGDLREILGRIKVKMSDVAAACDELGDKRGFLDLFFYCRSPSSCSRRASRVPRLR